MIERSVGRSSDDDELVIEKSLSFLRPWRIMQPFLLDSLIAFQTKSLLVASFFLSSFRQDGGSGESKVFSALN